MSEAFTFPTRDQLIAMSLDDLQSLENFIRSVKMQKKCPGSLSARLAEVALGQSVLFEDIDSIERLKGRVKVVARRRIEEPEAQWQLRSTTKGIRVTRVR